jgi:hypothetical protein
MKNATCRIGLDPDELEDLAKAGQQGRAQKCSTRELSLFLATQRHYEMMRHQKVKMENANSDQQQSQKDVSDIWGGRCSFVSCLFSFFYPFKFGSNLACICSWFLKTNSHHGCVYDGLGPFSRNFNFCDGWYWWRTS